MKKRLIAVVLSVLTVLVVSQIFSIGPTAAQNAQADALARPLEPESVPIRLVMGIGDSTPTDWSGQVSVDKGEVVSVEGLRFRAGDEVNGKSSWKASSRLIRKTAARKAAAKALAKARAKAKAQAPSKAQSGPSTFGPDVTPNGVIVTHDPKTGSFSTVERLTDQPGPDTDAVLATASDGTIWMAWQAWRGGQADIELAPLGKDGKLAAPPIKLSDGPADEWSPSIAADSSGRLHVAFDSYAAGNYDVILRSREPDGTLSKPVTVAGTAAFEARPSVAADARGRVWVAYEERTPNWGLDRPRHDPFGPGLVGSPALDQERWPARWPHGSGASQGWAGPGVLQQRRPPAPGGRDEPEPGPPLFHQSGDAAGGFKRRL